MANYGLVSDVYKYGSGSLFTPYNTSLTKRFVINPEPTKDFSIDANQDFYLSTWIKYGDINIATLGAEYPIIQYGDDTSGWEIGVRVENIGGNQPIPYFKYNGNLLTTFFNGSNGNLISPTSSYFDQYVIYRTNGVIHFEFKANGTTISTAWTQATYTGSIAKNVAGGITLGSTQPIATSPTAVNGAWIDELFFARGVHSVAAYKPTGEINDGALTTTAFLYHFNGNYIDSNDFVIYADMTASTSLTASAKVIKSTTASLVLTTTAITLVAKIKTYLQLIYNANNSSGYITTPGTQIRQAIDYVAGPTGQHLQGNHGVQANFWFSLGRQLTANETVEFYSDQANILRLTYSEYTPGGDLLDGGPQYQFIRTQTMRWIDPTDHATDSRGYFLRFVTYTQYVILNPGFDPREWHNINTPINFAYGSYQYDPGYPAAGKNPGALYLNYNGHPISIDGQVNDNVYLNDSALNSGTFTRTWVNAYEYNLSSTGGRWGFAGNPCDLYLDQNWIRTNSYSSSTVNESFVSASEFISSNDTSSISGQGLTPGGYQAQVWLPWGNLLDHATTTDPTWNYVGHNVVVPGLVIQASANLSANTATTATALKIQPGRISLSANASMTTNAGKVRYFTAAVSATASESITPQRLAGFIINAFATASLSSPINRLLTSPASLQTSTNLSVNPVKIARTPASLQTTSSLTASAVRTRNTASGQQASTAQTAQVVRTARTTASLQAFASELAVVVKTGKGLIHADVNASLTAQVKKITNQSIQWTASTTLQATGQVIRKGQASLTTSTSLTAAVNKIRITISALSATASLQATGKLIRQGAAAVSASTAQTTSTANSKITRVQANLQTSATLRADNQIIKIAQANLTTDSTVFCSAFKVFRAEIHMQAFTAELVAGRILDIDTYYQIRIKPETRGLLIQEESRLLVINPETRVNIIKGKTS